MTEPRLTADSCELTMHCWTCYGRAAKRAFEAGADTPFPRFIVCEECGNKRCHKAIWHGFMCTDTNDNDENEALPWKMEGWDEACSL